MARFRRTALAAGAAAVLLLLSGCSSSGDDDAAARARQRRQGGWSARPTSRRKRPHRSDGVAEVADSSSPAATGRGAGGRPVEQQKVISTGNVQLRSDDVGQAIFDVRKVVDVHGGTISEDDTETDKDGEALRSRMVLRIPTADFDDAMAELEKVATLVSSKRAERRRDHPGPRHRRPGRGPAAQHRPDPGPLRQRHHDQGRRQRRGRALPPPGRPRLAARRSSATSPTRPRCRPSRSRSSGPASDAKPKPKDDDDEPASCPGSPAAGSALKTFLVGGSTVAGALLPWLVLVLVLAIPGWPLVRRLRRRQARRQSADLVSGGAQPRERPDRRPHRRRQHLAQARRGAARGGREVRRTDGQARLRRLDRLPPERLAQRAAEVRRPADAADRQHHRQELHRLGADHRRDGPALLRQRRRLRAGLQRQRLHLAGDPAARLGPDRLRDGAAQDPAVAAPGGRPVHLPGGPARRRRAPRSRHRRRRPPSRAGSPTCAGCSSGRSTAPRTTTAGRRCPRSPTT